ncbi:MAG: hypothetical protein EOO93_19730 [Pedobacter sp.]|nr:MAG: hypothetical protein EOO93_19730 [Pedobacter sp.]
MAKKAKLLLNKAVYKSDPNNPAGPFTFEKADMDQVVKYVDAITAAIAGLFFIYGQYEAIGDPDEGTIILPKLIDFQT